MAPDGAHRRRRALMPVRHASADVVADLCGLMGSGVCVWPAGNVAARIHGRVTRVAVFGREGRQPGRRVKTGSNESGREVH